ncbi:uncharacterized protein LOC107865557 isoform X3 [Capsicum annuum]|uniref:uncharacterized protein LOC107865557 isoform X3 n=1 Tax=Capsicum annuum TaxID=4072 RepID=UPI001FB15002|nr:uncharacterized protein LOC107865557 isoform X3 [Capsicum annuum]
MGTVSSGIGFLSQFFASDYAASTHQFCCFSANSSPLHVNFSRSAAGCLVKRSSLLSSRVSVLTAGNSKIDGVDDQLSLSSDEIKPARENQWQQLKISRMSRWGSQQAISVQRYSLQEVESGRRRSKGPRCTYANRREQHHTEVIGNLSLHLRQTLPKNLLWQ